MSKVYRKRTQYVEEMIKNFHTLFESGMKIAEIAEQYNVDLSYTYKLLEEIAILNGVTREYYKTRDANTSHSNQNLNGSFYTHYTQKEYDEIMGSFERAISDIENLRQDIETFTKNNATEVEKECNYENYES